MVQVPPAPVELEEVAPGVDAPPPPAPAPAGCDPEQATSIAAAAPDASKPAVSQPRRPIV
jgi:hypothetical protein